MQFPERSLTALHLFEPSLEFAYGQTTAHPKDGLFLYGPHQRPKKTKEVRIGVVGTPAGINYFRSWAARIKKRVEVPPPGKGEKKDRLHLANFPGIEEVFAITFNDSEFVTYPHRPRQDRHGNAHPQSARGRRKGRPALRRARAAAPGQ